MKHNVELLKADVQLSLNKLNQLLQSLQPVEDQFRQQKIDLTDLELGGVAYALQSFYNGCENIFQSIARFFENDIGHDSWHKDLLRRMLLQVEGYRPAVIDEALFKVLDQFRGVRHVLRNSYVFELDAERMKPIVLSLIPAYSQLREQLQRFFKDLEQLLGE